MNRSVPYFLIILLSLSACNKDTISTDQEAQGKQVVTLTIHADDEKQTIHNFGASDAWSAQFVGKNWPSEKRQRIADLLFSTELDPQGDPEGIGLSLWRFNIGAGSARQGNKSGISNPWRRSESFLTADSSYDWSKLQGQQWFMRAAKERGVNQFIGFTNSPPLLLTKNGKAYGDGSGYANIASSNYDEFADYLAKIAAYFRDEGIPFTYISPVNEPQWNWSENNGQEGSPYQNDEIAAVIKALDQKIREYNLKTKIMVPETGRIDFLYAGDLSGRSHQIEYFFGANSSVEQLATVAHKIAGHSYHITWPLNEMIEQRRKVGESVKNTDPELEYWMSEYCILAHNEEIRGGGRDLGMDPALYVARVMHFDLTAANASSWQWWLGISANDYKDGLVYIDRNTQNGKVYESKLLWGVGNYSRFIRPGAVRLGITRSDNLSPVQMAKQIMVSAYLHNGDQQLTIVAINYSDTDSEIEVSTEGIDINQLSYWTPYITSGDADLEKQETVEKGQPVTIPARSIVTLVGSL